MATSLVLTFIGDDRPGLVNAIAETVAGNGGTWLESRLAHLAGKFAGIVLVSVPNEHVDRLASALRGLDAKGLRVSVERGAGAAATPGARVLHLAVLGAERPGIVRDVTQALTGLGVNIEDFTSGVEGEPFTGRQMFRASARLGVPDSVADETLRMTLERLAGEIMVDLAVKEAEVR